MTETSQEKQHAASRAHEEAVQRIRIETKEKARGFLGGCSVRGGEAPRIVSLAIPP